MPKITPIDLRKDQPDKGRWLAPQLVDAVTETLANKQQSLLFLNRRGYAPLTLCRKCGERIQCPQCTAWLVEHRFRKRLNCHHCGFSLSIPEKCPNCGEPGGLVACGPGVERVAEEVAERFPEARLALLSSDLVPGLTEMREIIKKIEGGEIDIIIGTQIVAKGHHFPGLSLVGIVDGDLGLAQGADPRAGERTFQLLHQVTGRAGRTFARGRGFIQTHMPEHPVMAAIISGDREAFLNREVEIAPARSASALRPTGGARRLGARQGNRGTRRARYRTPGAEVGANRRAGTSRGADCHRARAPSLAAAGQGAARDGRARIPQGLAGRVAEAANRHPADGRYRSLQLPLRALKFQKRLAGCAVRGAFSTNCLARLPDNAASRTLRPG